MTRIIAAPLIILAAGFLYMGWEVKYEYLYGLVPTAVLLAALYVLSPEIDWWWYKRNPPPMDPPLHHFFERFLPFYRNLPKEEKKRFQDRIMLFNLTRDYQGQGLESIPEDIKGILAASAVWLTFWQEDYLLEPFQKNIIYPHPFPSPQHPHHWHSVEVFTEDGVVLNTAEHLLKGFTQPQLFYPIGLHTYALVLQEKYPNLPYPSLPEDIWSHLEQISGFKRTAIEEFIGLPEVNLQAICITCLFYYADAFRGALPELYAQYEALLMQPQEEMKLTL
jgi:hypothetical protein